MEGWSEEPKRSEAAYPVKGMEDLETKKWLADIRTV